MTTFPSPGSASEPAPARPGRKLGPIAETVSTAHCAWLKPTRKWYLSSGFTLDELSRLVPLAKSKLSELLRGIGHYPRWEVTYRLAVVLGIPSWPLYRLWRQAAVEAGKSRDWVDRSTDNTVAVVTVHPVLPLELGALRSTVENGYLAYTGAFLTGEAREAVVEDAFDQLWLHFDEALSSPDVRRYAWKILRVTVMARVAHRGRPELGEAAFDTVALREETTAEAEQLTESMALFAAMNQLPEAQLDVIVLRRMCGFPPERVADLLGVPLAAVRSDERHANRLLDTLIELHATEGPTP